MAGRIRSLQSPGVEIVEIDKSQIAPSISGTYVLIPGFADQGEDFAVMTGNSIDQFVSVYGQPTNEAERYFYHAAKDVVQEGATAITVKIPYDNIICQNYNATKLTLNAPTNILNRGGISELTTIADVSLIGKYFTITSSNLDTYCVWYGLAGTSAPTGHAGSTMIKVLITEDDSSSAVATKTKTALDSKFTVTRSGSELTILSAIINVGNSGFTANTTSEVFTVTTNADVASNLVNTYFNITSSSDTYTVWYGLTGTTTITGQPSGNVLVKVVIVEGDTAIAVATKTKSALDSTFAVTRIDNELTITVPSDSESIANVVDGDTAFDISKTVENVKLTAIADVSLVGKYFNISDISNTYCVWYGLSDTATITGQDSGTILVKVLIAKNDDSATIATKTKTALDAKGFNVTRNSNVLSILTQADNNSDVDILVGTSGFTLEITTPSVDLNDLSNSQLALVSSFDTAASGAVGNVFYSTSIDSISNIDSQSIPINNETYDIISQSEGLLESPVSSSVTGTLGYLGSAWDLLLVDISKSILSFKNLQFNLDQTCEGMFVAIVDYAAASYVQRLTKINNTHPDDDVMDLIKFIEFPVKTDVNTFGTSVSIDESKVGVKLYDKYMYTSFSEDLMRKFPAINIISPVREESATATSILQASLEYANFVTIVVGKVKTDLSANNGQVLPEILATYFGSLDENSKDHSTGQSNFICNVVNSSSPYIRLFDNKTETLNGKRVNTITYGDGGVSKLRGIADGKVCVPVMKYNSGKLPLIGFNPNYDVDKIITTEGIMTSLDKVFAKVGNIDDIQIDIVLDAGLTTIAEFVSDASTGY